MLLYKIMEIYNMLIKLPIIFIRKKNKVKIYIYILVEMKTMLYNFIDKICKLFFHHILSLKFGTAMSKIVCS